MYVSFKELWNKEIPRAWRRLGGWWSSSLSLDMTPWTWKTLESDCWSDWKRHLVPDGGRTLIMTALFQQIELITDGFNAFFFRTCARSSCWTHSGPRRPVSLNTHSFSILDKWRFMVNPVCMKPRHMLWMMVGFVVLFEYETELLVFSLQLFDSHKKRLNPGMSNSF